MTTSIRPHAEDPRPDLSHALSTLTQALLDFSTELPRIDAGRVLFVPLAAHGTVAASVRGLSDVARSVSVDGARRTHEVGLRPRFFLGATVSSRLTTLVHELLHIDADGGLLEARRHAHRSHVDHERDASRIAARALDVLAPELLVPLGHHGEVRMRAWRVRPSETTHARAFTSRDVYWQPVVMETPRRARTSWG